MTEQSLSVNLAPMFEFLTWFGNRIFIFRHTMGGSEPRNQSESSKGHTYPLWKRVKKKEFTPWSHFRLENSQRRFLEELKIHRKSTSEIFDCVFESFQIAEFGSRIFFVTPSISLRHLRRAPRSILWLRFSHSVLKGALGVFGLSNQEVRQPRSHPKLDVRRTGSVFH